MNRLLLALLALFAGLAAQIAPAQARMISVGETQIGTAAGCRKVRPSPSPSAEPQTPVVVRQAKREREAKRPRALRLWVLVPTVLFGADRAYE